MWPTQGHTAGQELVSLLGGGGSRGPWGVAWATIVQVLCVPVHEEEGEGLALRGTRPREEDACSLGGLAQQPLGLQASGGGGGRT